MQHLDEHQLHAYLDQEMVVGRADAERHLTECTACRARLEEARQLRARAGVILEGADPAKVTVPPFEQVLQRAQRRRATRRPPRVPLVLAWAASLAVAVTAGWFARGLSVPSPSTRSELARARAVDAIAPQRNQLAQAAEPARNAPQAAALPQTANAVAARPPATGAVDTTAPVEAEATQHVAAEMKGAVAPERAAETAAAAPTAPAPALQRVAAPVTAAQARWTTVSRTVAEERVDGKLATIPGLPLLGFSVSGTGASTVVRTIQVLGTGATIELYQRRAALQDRATERSAVLQPEAPGAQAREKVAQPEVASITVDWEGYRVTGTARVSVDSLRKLLARLGTP
jgi:hypothetical protein